MYFHKFSFGKSVPIYAAALAVALGVVATLPADAQAETRTYIVSWFYDANYYGGDADCPEGLNLSSIDFFRRDLRLLGLPFEKVEELLKDFPGEGGLPQPWAPYVMTRGNGKDNVYIFPTTARDPGLKTVKGRYSYGFNLDAREGADDFIEPDTGERGIDNQLFRARGCIRSYRGVPPPGRPGLPENLWNRVRDMMPPWLISISAPNGFFEGSEVSVTLDRSVDQPIRDANGDNFQPDMTYRIDPDPRSHNVLRGRIVNGMVIVQAANVSMAADAYLMPMMQFSQAQLRLEFKRDGSLGGMLGGYQTWQPIWYGLAFRGVINEYAASIDLPGLYYALTRLADADPDPKTGANRSISSAYVVEAVRAFVVPMSPTDSPLQTNSKTPRVAR